GWHGSSWLVAVCEWFGWGRSGTSPGGRSSASPVAPYRPSSVPRWAFRGEPGRFRARLSCFATPTGFVAGPLPVHAVVAGGASVAAAELGAGAAAETRAALDGVGGAVGGVGAGGVPAAAALDLRALDFSVAGQSRRAAHLAGQPFAERNARGQCGGGGVCRGPG